jgi:hypothetical protein
MWLLKTGGMLAPLLTRRAVHKTSQEKWSRLRRQAQEGAVLRSPTLATTAQTGSPSREGRRDMRDIYVTISEREGHERTQL